MSFELVMTLTSMNQTSLNVLVAKSCDNYRAVALIPITA